MNQVIFILTTPKRQDFLANCLKPFEAYDKYPLIILSDYSYPPGKALKIQKMGGVDELIVLSDSTEITDTKIIDMCFEHRGECVSVNRYPRPFFFFSKLTFDVFSQLEFPQVSTKKEEVLHENDVMNQLDKLVPHPVILFDDITYDWLEPNPKTGKVAYEEFRFGRWNKVTGNSYFKKYQGTWNLEMAPDILTKR